MTDGENFLISQLKVTWEQKLKFETDQGDDYLSGCLLDYNYFNEHYKMVAIDLSKQQETLDADPKAIQQISFTGNLGQEQDTIMFFIIEEAKETILDFSQKTVKALWMCSITLFCSKILSI